MAETSLEVKLRAEIADLRRKLETSRRDVDKWSAGVIESGKRAALGFAAVSTAITAVGSVALGAAAKGLFQLGKELSEQVHELQTHAARVGLSTTALSELKFAAQQTGVDFQTLSTSIQNLNRRVADAKAGNETYARTLGLLQRESGQVIDVSKGTEAQFLQVANALSKIPDQGQKTLFAFQLFGEEGSKLLRLMNQGSGGIQALREEARRLGVSLSSEVIDAATGFREEWGRLQAAIEGVKIAIAAAALPVMTQLIHVFAGWVSQNREFLALRVREAIITIVETFFRLVGILATLRRSMLEHEDLWLRFKQTVTDLIPFMGFLVDRQALAVEIAKTQEALGRAIVDETRAEASARDLTLALMQRHQTSAKKVAEFTGQITADTLRAGKAQDEHVREFERFQESMGQAIVDSARMNFEIGEKRRKAHADAVKAIARIEEELAAAQESELSRRLTAIDKERQARIAAVREALAVQKEFEAGEASTANEAFEIRRRLLSRELQLIHDINEEAARQERKVFEDLAEERARKAFELEDAITMDLMSEQQRRMTIIDDELRQRINAIREFVDDAEKQEELITAATEAAARKREQIISGVGDFWTRQLNDLVNSNVFSLGQITTQFSGAVADWMMGLDSFRQFGLQVLRTLLQAMVQFVIQWIALEALRAATTQGANSAIAGSTLAAFTMLGTGIKLLFLGLARAVVGVIGVVVSGISVILNSVSVVVAFMLFTVGQMLIELGTALQKLPLIVTNIIGAILIGLGSATIALATALPGLVAAITAGLSAGVASLAAAIPAMAHGGIVTQPTLALIGEAGPEAVVPLSGRGAALAGAGETHIHVHVGSREVMHEVLRELPRTVRLRTGLAFG